MTIQSDSFGFLVGDPADWGEALKLWAAIQDDVRGIRQALTSSAAAAKRVTQSSTAPALALPRRQSAAAAKVVQITSRTVVQPASLLKTAVVSKDVLRTVFPATVRRDANGRFVRTVTPNAPRAGQDQPSERNGKGESTDGRSAVSGRIGAVGAMASNAIDRAPDVDPAIAAAKELSAIVTPIGRGFGKMLGRDGEEKKKVIWFKQLWTELRGLRRDETEFSKAQLRKLAAIEKKPAAGSSSGGLLSRLAPKIPGLGMLGNLLGKGGKGLFGLGKGLFRRLPLLGAMLAGGSALASMFGSDDPDKTPAENRKGRFAGGGSGIGALIGGGIGLAFGGPIGAMIGGFIGDKLGEVTGEWLALALFYVLPLRPLVDAKLQVPPIFVFPSFEQDLEKGDAITQFGIGSLIVKVVAPACNADLTTPEELLEFARKHEDAFLDAVSRDRLFVPAGVDPHSVGSAREAATVYLNGLEGIRSEEALSQLKRLPCGVLVFNGILERLRPIYHLIENSEELVAQPILSQDTHWHYFELCVQAEVSQLVNDKVINRESLDVLRAMQDDSLTWLANIPIEGLAELRRNHEHAELREHLKKCTAQLTSAGPAEIEAVTKEVRHGLEVMIQRQQKAIIDIEARYAPKKWAAVTGGALSLAAGASMVFMPALAVAAGVAIPVASALAGLGGGGVAYIKEMVGQATDKNRARKSMLGLLATARKSKK
jgi:hypothetical protein